MGLLRSRWRGNMVLTKCSSINARQRDFLEMLPGGWQRKKISAVKETEQPRRCFSPPLRSLPPGQVAAARPSRSSTFTNAKRHSQTKGLTKIFHSLFFVTEAYKIPPFLKPPSPCYCACGVWASCKKSSIALAESKSS